MKVFIAKSILVVSSLSVVTLVGHATYNSSEFRTLVGIVIAPFAICGTLTWALDVVTGRWD